MHINGDGLLKLSLALHIGPSQGPQSRYYLVWWVVWKWFLLGLLYMCIASISFALLVTGNCIWECIIICCWWQQSRDKQSFCFYPELKDNLQSQLGIPIHFVSSLTTITSHSNNNNTNPTTPPHLFLPSSLQPFPKASHTIHIHHSQDTWFIQGLL